MNDRLRKGPASDRLRALIEISQSILQHRDLADLIDDLAVRLQPVAPFDVISLILHDPATGRMRLHTLRGPLPPPSLPEGLPAEESPAWLVWKTQQPMVFDDLSREDRFPALVPYWREKGIRFACLLPLTTAQRRLGAMAFAATRHVAEPEYDLEFLGSVVREVAVAVDNALHHQEVQSYQRRLARERDRLRTLLELTNAVVSRLDLRELFAAISSSLRQLFDCEFASLALYEPETDRLRIRALDFPTGKGLIREEMTVELDAAPSGEAFRRRQPLLLGRAELERYSHAATIEAEGLRSALCLPLVGRTGPLGTLNLASLRESAFSQEDVDFLRQVADQIAIAMENALAFQKIERQKDRLAEEKLYLEDELRSEYGLDEIIGESPAWRETIAQVRRVAPTESTVLLLGETGTGKELLARLTHQLSGRRARNFVKVNCAAIPTGLLESELFGHERGAFTGAINRRVGRFELADQGTLFLDEIGDIPLDLQPKLLRVLQEREFERLGSSQTLRVDVRLVAATNRDLATMVAEGLFRNDLYYRINIFPIRVPPLRERVEDIPLFARYFAQKHAALANKRIETIPAEAIEAMTQYPWPGNVRELENLIERAVILSPGTTLRVPLAELNAPAARPESSPALLDIEREHILRILQQTRWRISGPSGAAARLGMKRTTLQSRMRKLGIQRPRAER